MKVYEHCSDRKAAVNIRKELEIAPLDEYGRHVDPDDGAICAYVPIDENDNLRVTTTFNGTTRKIVWELSVDGVLRKVGTVASKTVVKQKSLKMDFKTILVKSKDNEIKSAKMVAKSAKDYQFEKNEKVAEKMGTIELRIYVERVLGEEHDARSDIPWYYDAPQEMDKEVTIQYQDVLPDFLIELQRDASSLDSRQVKAEKKKATMKRPGKQPWAIFRFHYRSEESIKKANLTLMNDKAAHELALAAVPNLKIGARVTDADTSSAQHEDATHTPSTDLPSATTMGEMRNRTDSPKSESTAQEVRQSVEQHVKVPASGFTAVNTKVKPMAKSEGEKTGDKHALQTSPQPSKAKRQKVSSASKDSTNPTTPVGTNATSAPAVKVPKTATNLAPAPAEKRTPTPVRTPTPAPAPAPVQTPIAEPTPAPEPTSTALLGPALTLTPTPPARAPSHTPSPLSIEQRLSQKRAQHAALVAEREAREKRRQELDAMLAPYQKRMEQELAAFEAKIEEENLRAKDDDDRMRAMEAELRMNKERDELKEGE